MLKNLPRYERCFVCGRANPIGLNITFKRVGDEVYCEFKPDERYIGYPGRVHGGILAAVLDEVMGWACSVASGKFFYTVEFAIRYKRPAAPGKKLIARAMSKAQKHGLTFAEAQLKYEDGTIIATAKGAYYPLSDEETRELLPLMHHEPDDGRPVLLDDI